MCYDIKTNLEAQLSRANRKGDLQAIKEIKEKFIPLTIYQFTTPLVSTIQNC